jgi:hypothetical protein
VVLANQAWTYWIFRARVGAASVGADPYSTATLDRIRLKAATTTDPIGTT